MFPKITRPCPYADRIASVMDGDFCRMCDRSVTDLSAMAASERKAFLSACGTEEVCVSYRVTLSMAAALAAVALPGAAFAQDAPPAVEQPPADETEIILMGGIRPQSAERLSVMPVTVIKAEDLTRSERRRRAPHKPSKRSGS